MTKQLLTPKDVKEIREALLIEQKNRDALTGLTIPAGQAVLDHNHKTQYVRAVLHRQCNAVLGKIENLWTRYLSYWYNGTLPQFLRSAADYLERKDDTRYLHPGWIDRVQIEFNKLRVEQQVIVLRELTKQDYAKSNPVKRKSAFAKAVKSNEFKFRYILDLIERNKA